MLSWITLARAPSESEVIMLINKALVLHFFLFSFWRGWIIQCISIDPCQSLKLISHWLYPKHFTRASDSLTAPFFPLECKLSNTKPNYQDKFNLFLCVLWLICASTEEISLSLCKWKLFFHRLWQITTSESNESHIHGSFSQSLSKKTSLSMVNLAAESFECSSGKSFSELWLNATAYLFPTSSHHRNSVWFHLRQNNRCWSAKWQKSPW